MSAIGPGDYVECVNASAPDGYGWRPEDELTVGAIYQVVTCWVNALGEDSVEIRNHPRVSASRQWGFKVGYWVGRFRPIYRPKSELIETLKQPAPDIVRELEDA